MKNVAEAINKRDGVRLSLIANEHPEKRPEGIPQQAIDVFNDLFKQLRATFPAMMSTIKDQAQLNELRRQWVKAIAENEIYQKEQIEAGMKRARQHEKPFLPSPGEFISWCKAGSVTRYGLPDAEGLYDAVQKYHGRRFQYKTPEDYPWTSNAEYWLVTAVSAKMRTRALTIPETLKACEREIKNLTEKLNDGFTVPTPVPQIEKQYTPSSPDVARANIARLKAMIKAKK